MYFPSRIKLYNYFHFIKIFIPPSANYVKLFTFSIFFLLKYFLIKTEKYFFFFTILILNYYILFLKKNTPKNNFVCSPNIFRVCNMHSLYKNVYYALRIDALLIMYYSEKQLFFFIWEYYFSITL